MGGATLSQIRHQARRRLAPALAIILGVAFVAATLTLRAGMQASLADSVAGSLTGTSAAVTARDTPLTDAQVRTIAATPGVTSIVPEVQAPVELSAGERSETAIATTATASQLRALQGSVDPAGGVVLNQDAARRLNAAVGSTVRLGERAALVRGIVDLQGNRGRPTVIGTGAQVLSWTGSTGYDAVLTRGGDQASVAAALRERLGSKVTVRTATAETDRRVSDGVVGISVITTFFALFAAVAMFVCAMVIANTFRILLAGRTRELALLRCVGASRRQVRRSVLVESLVLGAVASALGVGLGVGLVAGFQSLPAASETLQLPMNRVHVTPVALGLPWLVGTLVTVIAAAGPARTAARTTPLAALTAHQEQTPTARTSRLRLVVGATAIVVGLAALVVGAQAGTVPVAALGGFVSFLGVIWCAPVLVPGLARRLGRLGGRGVTAELAVDNTTRNPRRTAATSTALLVGITLLVTMVVGAATSTKAIADQVDSQFALDLQVTGAPEAPATVTALRAIPGVERVAELHGVQAKVGDPTRGRSMPVAAVPDEASAVLRDRSALTGLAPGTVLLDDTTAGLLSVSAGDRVRVGATTLRVVVAPKTVGDAAMVSTADLAAVGSHHAVGVQWLRLADGAEVSTVVDQVRRSLGDQVQIAGSADARAELDSVVRVVLLIVSALLGVAVLIAIVGVANTLSLSVLERRRETALLRALGLTVRQVRRMLAVEAALVCTVAALLGSILGVLYGWAGARSLLGRFADGVGPQLPVGTLVLVLLGAAGCGLLASVAPGARAARIPPTRALAAD